MSAGRTQTLTLRVAEDFRVRSVASGTGYSRVLRNFGKPIPVAQKKITDETCGPAEAKRYEELKQSLAEQYPNDRVGYTEGKTEYVLSVTERAKQYYDAT